MKLASILYRKKTIQNLDNKLKLLGDQEKIKSVTFLNVRTFLSLVLFIVILFFFKHGYILAPIITVLFYVLLEKIMIDYKIKKREKKLEKEAIFFFEVFILTLESSRNIKGALELTTENIDNELSYEFKKTLKECRVGKSFTESLRNMKERIPSDNINNMILSLTESSIFGSSIQETLNNQLDYIREKRLLETKGEISKLPTKISIISVIFFIPLMLMIILSPVLIEFLLG